MILSLLIAGTAPSRGPAADAPSAVVAAVYRPDTPFPKFMPLWLEAWALKDGAGESVQPDTTALGGYVHVYFRNADSRAVSIRDVLLEGVSLTKAIASSKEEVIGLHPASIRFSQVAKADFDRLMAAGEPLWWRLEPESVPAGGFGELVVRLRRAPAAEQIALTLVTSAARTEARIETRKPQPRIVGISFQPTPARAFLYLRHAEAGVPPTRLLMDGRDVTAQATIAADPSVDTTPVVIRLSEPVARMSFHCFQAVYADGSMAVAAARAWHDDFVYGMWGYTNKGRTPEERAKNCLLDLARHNINAHMYSMGDWGPFIQSNAGYDFLASIGMRVMTHAPGNTRNPLYYFLMDEPDAHDYAVRSLEPALRLGALAQPLVERSRELRRTDPLTPHLLNVDNTYKPENWYTYAQLPDVMCADPYYQEQLKIVYNARPNWLAQFVKPTYVYAVATICRSAAAPKPVHIILNAVRHDNKEEPFRFATPAEKRIELYYALAAGAKGISYWWYAPYGEFYGVGGSGRDATALWTEIGLLGAEARTAGPLLLRSCPADLPVKASKYLWVRSLLAGADTIVVFVVNDNHANDRTGTVIFPVQKPSLAVRVPRWLSPEDAFEITYEGIRDVSWKKAEPDIRFDLGVLAVTRLLVITSDAQLRSQLADAYRTQFAANVAKLIPRRTQ